MCGKIVQNKSIGGKLLVNKGLTTLIIGGDSDELNEFLCQLDGI